MKISNLNTIFKYKNIFLNIMFKLKNYVDRVDFTEIELTMKEAILAKCWDCCCYEKSEVKACTIKHCPLMKFKDKWLNKVGKKELAPNDKRRNNTFGKN